MEKASAPSERPTHNRPKAAYEAPRMEVIEMQPEEHLLACLKIVMPMCIGSTIS